MHSPASIAELLAKQAESFGDKLFLVSDSNQYSYTDVDKLSSSAAKLLADKHGVKKGDSVCFMLKNSAEFIILWLALSKLGAILVPINPAYKKKEAEFIVVNSEAVLSIVDEDSDQKISSVKKSSIEELINGKKVLGRDTPVQSNNTAGIVYTSGTSGHPKGVILPHRSYIIGGESFAMRANLSSEDRIMLILPLFHVNAQIYSTMGCLVAGATLVIREKFRASKFWSEILKFEITQFNFLGVIANILLKNPPQTEEANHKVRVAFGAGLSATTIEEFEKRFKIPLIETYGLTEVPMGTSNLINERKVGSIGKPSKHPNPSLFTKLKVVNQNLEELPTNSAGEILLKSPAQTPGYYKNEKANSECFTQDGWFRTGDRGYIDEKGYVFFLDREKDIIRKKGENISSKQIEDAILKHPNVSEVAVVPIPGPLGGDDIKAYIVLKPNQKLTSLELKRHCKAELNHQSTPAVVEFIDELPKTPTNKISKHILKEISKKQIAEQIPIKTISDSLALIQESESNNPEQALEKAINNANLTIDHIEKIILLGGDEKTKQQLSKSFQINPSRIVIKDEKIPIEDIAKEHLTPQCSYIAILVLGSGENLSFIYTVLDKC